MPEEPPVPSPARADPAPPGAAQGPTPPGQRRWWIAVVLLAAVAVGAAWWVRARQASKAGSAPATAQQAARPVPVLVAPVGRRDVPVFLEGLGNVVAFKTVTVRTQVDGRLDQVFFREGQAVHRGEALAQIDPRPFQAQLQQARGALARDEAQLRGAQLNLQRYRALVGEKLIPPQQADDQAALVGQLEGAVQMDRAAIATARLNLDYARIVSPIDGVTGIRSVDPGNVVHPGDQNGIVVITQLDPVAVLFTLPQDDLVPVATEQARRPLPVDVQSRDGTTSLGTGELALIDNQINQATSTIRLKAILPNPRHLLWPNQFVNVRLRLTTRPGALVIPATAVQRGPAGAFVYLVGGDQTASPRPVEIDLVQGEVAVVAKGLQEGERVVVDGQNQLRPGSRVAPREAGSPQAAAQPATPGATAGAPESGAASGAPARSGGSTPGAAAPSSPGPPASAGGPGAAGPRTAHDASQRPRSGAGDGAR